MNLLLNLRTVCYSSFEHAWWSEHVATQGMGQKYKNGVLSVRSNRKSCWVVNSVVNDWPILYHSNIIFGWTWMWSLLTSHSVLPHQSSVCQQYKTTWLDATVSKHPIRCALFFFLFLYLFLWKHQSHPRATCPCHHLSSRGFTCQLQEVTMSTYGRSILTVIYIHMEK